MTAPTFADAQTYLSGDASSWTPLEVAAAFDAEKAAQANVCAVPGDNADWPLDLVEALFRRTAHNLAVRRNPSGVQTAESEFGVTQLRIGGNDAEVNRLEAPYRLIPVA